MQPVERSPARRVDHRFKPTAARLRFNFVDSCGGLSGTLCRFMEMKAMSIPNNNPSNGISIPRWLAFVLAPLAWLIAIPLAHGVVPWAFSLSTPRYGWMEGNPRLWHLLGLIPVLIGASGLVWTFVIGLAHASEVPEKVGLDWTPKLLMRRGPYTLTRNPMYVAEMALWLGWAIFYGSVAVLIGFVIVCVVMSYIVRREERDLEAQFGEMYLQYKGIVPRWFGKVKY